MKQTGRIRSGYSPSAFLSVVDVTYAVNEYYSRTWFGFIYG
jgi:hypothetical protein